MKSIFLLETVFPDYRMGLFRRLKEIFGDRLTLACGDVSYSKTLQTAPTAKGLRTQVTNRFWLGRRLLWQSGAPQLASAADLVIAEFNLRAPSTWWLLWNRHRRGKSTVFWGHVSGSRSISEPVRWWMLRRAAGFIAYMPAEKQRLQEEFPNLPVWIAPNAMMWARDCHFLPRDSEEVCDVIYVGRLVTAKKVGHLLNGFVAAVRENRVPARSRLIFVGDGPERNTLAAQASAAGLTERVVFAGHVSDIAKLREWYSTALIAVSPGYVGLSATQAFSFGVPMLVADGERHSPEIELCQPGENTIFFQANDPTSLAEALGVVMRDRKTWIERREAISAAIRSNYSFDRMAETFVNVIAAFDGTPPAPRDT